MYSVSQILKGVKNPLRTYIELNRIYHEYMVQTKRISVMEQDWDTLIILDACRYDLFRQVNAIPGNLQSVISLGSHTAEFLQRNFGDNEYLDTIYVSANPQLQNQKKRKNFFTSKCVWKDNWDQDLHTVKPDVVTDVGIKTYEKYPNKRLIVHYNQPHAPFIGEMNREFPYLGFGEDPDDFNGDTQSVWDMLEAGRVSKDRLWEAYRENLELALPEVERLVETVPGKSVITSDHGNAFGELGVYGHPGRHWVDELIRVPWLEVPFKTRRDIIKAEQRVLPEEEQDSLLKDRLADLGYRT